MFEAAVDQKFALKKVSQSKLNVSPLQKSPVIRSSHISDISNKHFASRDRLCPTIFFFISLSSLLLYFLMKSQGMLFTRRRLPQSEVCQVWKLIGDQKTGNRDFLVRTPRTNLCDQRRSARSVNLQCTNFTLNQTGVKLR